MYRGTDNAYDTAWFLFPDQISGYRISVDEYGEPWVVDEYGYLFRYTGVQWIL